MRFENRSVQLKDGRECVLRPTTAEYAQEMIDYMKITAAETPFLLRYPDEVKYTLENEKEILARIYGDEKTVMMLALVDGQVAGNCSISGLGDKRRILHDTINHTLANDLIISRKGITQIQCFYPLFK